ncbi:hypothetical protein O181_057967 [Austropuccinia psidii MF-1]|uniref:Reverse transcriptase RNase H-like domain-containing protein n=1 Tax=Austropuccinia psidii MF-1 TaxID=1389203 RepID=A0A9Q3EIT4_9BASI|nr:hypothetical protein [Austropuccinia psidii MF-1]
MEPLGIIEAEMMFPLPTRSIRLKSEFGIMNNHTSQHFILGSDYLNMYGINITNNKDRYFTIGKNERNLFAFHLEKKEITVTIQMKPTEARYEDRQMEFLFLVWTVEKLHYYPYGSALEVITNCNPIKSLLNKKTTNRHMLR